MFPCLASRPWHVLCRVSLQHKAPLSQRSPRIPQLCHGEVRNVIFRKQQRWRLFGEGIDCHPLCFVGWQSGSIHSWWTGLPECRVASSALGKFQYYSTSGNDKDVPPQPPPGGPPSAEQVLSAPTQGTVPPAGNPR